jgi:gamma-D-glutamyl-L-lysine dipeptidyl-peptidase
MRGAYYPWSAFLSASPASYVVGRASLTPVLAAGTVRAEQVTQLVLGETAAVLGRSGDWLRVRIDLDAYEGWAHRGYVQEVSQAEALEWRGRATGWSTGAQLEIDDGTLTLPLRARVAAESGAIILPDHRRAQLLSGSIPVLSDVRAEACSMPPERWALDHFSGSPYLWGGVTPWGVDCSGLVQTTFSVRGVSLPRDAAQQAGIGQSVALDACRPGDLLFFRSEQGNGITHVAFAGDAETLVHSTISCGGVLVEAWGPGTRAAALRDRLVLARRLEAR